MLISVSKNTIWFESNGSKKDNEKVVMFHRLMLEENNSYDGGGMLEESNKGGISLTICSFDTIEEMKNEVRYLKQIIKDENLNTIETDVLESREYEEQLNLKY